MHMVNPFSARTAYSEWRLRSCLHSVLSQSAARGDPLGEAARGCQNLRVSPLPFPPLRGLFLCAAAPVVQSLISSPRPNKFLESRVQTRPFKTKSALSRDPIGSFRQNHVFFFAFPLQLSSRRPLRCCCYFLSFTSPPHRPTPANSVELGAQEKKQHHNRRAHIQFRTDTSLLAVRLRGVLL